MSLTERQLELFKQYTQSIRQLYQIVETGLEDTFGNSRLIKPLFDQSAGKTSESWDQYHGENVELQGAVTKYDNGSYVAIPEDNPTENRTPLQTILFNLINDEDKAAAKELLTLADDASDLDVLKRTYSWAFNIQKQLYDSKTLLYNLAQDFYNRFTDNDEISADQKNKVQQAYDLLCSLSNLYNALNQLAENFEKNIVTITDYSDPTNIQNLDNLLLNLESVTLPEYQPFKQVIIEFIRERDQLFQEMSNKYNKVNNILECNKALLASGQSGFLCNSTSVPLPSNEPRLLREAAVNYVTENSIEQLTLVEEYGRFLTNSNYPQKVEIEQILRANEACVKDGQMGLLALQDITKASSSLEQFKAAREYVTNPESRYFIYRTPAVVMNEGSEEKCKDLIKKELIALQRSRKAYPFPELQNPNILTIEGVLALLDHFYGAILDKVISTDVKSTITANEWLVKTWLTRQLTEIHPSTQYMGLNPLDYNDVVYIAGLPENDDSSNSRFYFDASTSTIKFELYRNEKYAIIDPNEEGPVDYNNSNSNFCSSLKIESHLLKETLEVAIRYHSPAAEKLLPYMEGFDTLSIAQKSQFALKASAKDSFLHQVSTATVPVTIRLLAPSLDAAYALKKSMAAYIKEPGRSRERKYRANLLLEMANTFVEQYKNGRLTDSDCHAFMQACLEIQKQHQKDHKQQLFNRSNHLNEQLDLSLKGLKNVTPSETKKFSTATSLTLAKKLNKMYISIRSKENNNYEKALASRIEIDSRLITDLQRNFKNDLSMSQTESDVIALWEKFKNSLAEAVKYDMTHPKTAKELLALSEKHAFYKLVNLPKDKIVSQLKAKNFRSKLENATLFTAMKKLFDLGLSQSDVLKEINHLLNYQGEKDIVELFDNKEASNAIETLLKTPNFREFIIAEKFKVPGLVTQFLDASKLKNDIRKNIQQLMKLEHLTSDNIQTIKAALLENNQETLVKSAHLDFDLPFLKAFFENTTVMEAKHKLEEAAAPARPSHQVEAVNLISVQPSADDTRSIDSVPELQQGTHRVTTTTPRPPTPPDTPRRHQDGHGSPNLGFFSPSPPQTPTSSTLKSPRPGNSGDD